ncbi:hypothetical protein OHB05_38605 [Streptomyces sp. NBC_00638]|uniref:hypothetical protein n=1 Tax=Streptomyces sp. NBC_00638 TaxID=2975794 RepID=UPI002254E440|nr:hypothetical protein [Streptomyces sp. NBC_00638]MCX5008478.1 hypothetical protein [Streptomyces sp. NBC_00638]
MQRESAGFLGPAGGGLDGGQVAQDDGALLVLAPIEGIEGAELPAAPATSSTSIVMAAAHTSVQSGSFQVLLAIQRYTGSAAARAARCHAYSPWWNFASPVDSVGMSCHEAANAVPASMAKRRRP